MSMVLILQVLSHTKELEIALNAFSLLVRHKNNKSVPLLLRFPHRGFIHPKTHTATEQQTCLSALVQRE